MKKILLTVISLLILVFSSVLIYHIVTNEVVDNDKTGDEEYDTLPDISNEIDDFLLDENNEVDIGEMI